MGVPGDELLKILSGGGNSTGVRATYWLGNVKVKEEARGCGQFGEFVPERVVEG